MRRILAPFSLLAAFLPGVAAAQLDGTLPEERLAEQMAVLDLVPDGSETTTALADGAWSAPGTWSGGAVPGETDRVLVPEGITVRFEGSELEPVATLRVDGTLIVEPGSALVVDTWVVTHPGEVRIGSPDAPIPFDAPVRVEFRSQGVTAAASDLGLGLLSFGAAGIHGAPRSSHHRLAELPVAGATEVALAEAPFSWSVGDRLVLPATMPTELGGVDDVVTITAIEGTTVRFEPALVGERLTPHERFTPHVANLTRSVTFTSASTEQPARGHVQLMHRRDVDVRYAAFVDLGRSDRSRDYGADNPVQRYPLYVHGGGGGTAMERPVRVVGSVVERSLGQGFVARDTHIVYDHNVAFDLWGGAFIIESGNETGGFRSNIAIGVDGRSIDPKEAAGSQRYATPGVGYWIQSRLFHSRDNVAANVRGNGYLYFHRGTELYRSPQREHLEHRAAALYKGMREVDELTIDIDQASIQGFQDNEAYGVGGGLLVIKNNPAQNHDDRSILDGFVAWNVRAGASFDYTGHYLMRDFRVFAHPLSRDRPWSSKGLSLGQSIVDMTFDGAVVEGFESGLAVLFNSAEAKLRYNSYPGNVHVHAMAFTDNGVDIERNAHDLDHVVEHETEPEAAEIQVAFDPSSNRAIPESEVSPTSTLEFEGTKTDSLGETHYFFSAEREVERTEFRHPYEYSRAGLMSRGVFRGSDGQPYALFELLVSDRFTGAHRQLELPILLLRERLIEDATDGGEIAVNEVEGVVLTNSAPFAQYDTVVTRTHTPVEFDILANDSDYDGDAIELVDVGEPIHGSLEELGEGRYRYTPSLGHDGLDGFTYAVRDPEGSGRTSEGTVRIDIVATAGALPPPDPETPGNADLGGSPSGPDGGSGPMTPATDVADGGCGCRTLGGTRDSGPAALLGLLAFSWTVRRRRR